MSASATPDSSFTQEGNKKNPTLKLSLKGQPKSLPNLFESMNLQDGKPKPYSDSQNKAVVGSRVKSLEGKKVVLDPVLAKIETTPNSSFIQEGNNRNPTLKLSLKGQGSLPNIFKSLDLQDGKSKPYSQDNIATR